MKTYVATAHDTDYAQFEKMMAERVTSLKGPLFRTNTELFPSFLEGIPEGRQHYNCHCCRSFIERYCGLVKVDPETGALIPALVSLINVPYFFMDSMKNMFNIVVRDKITGVFINCEKTWGRAQTGPWTHLHGEPTLPMENGRIPLPSQIEADKKQDFIMLKHGLSDYKQEHVTEAVRILEADALDRSEKTLGVAKWFLELHDKIRSVHGRLRDNLIWLVVATAPKGFCHIRSTMISTLLDDIKGGLDFDAISSRWSKKMHPLQYQRPTAAPSAGNVEQANKLLEQLGAHRAMERRYARIEDLTSFWKPREESVAEKGYFDHLLKQVPVKPLELPTKTMTWKRFEEEVLPRAVKLELQAPAHGRYFAFVTAVHADAVPLLQWDNPVSWFYYDSGSSCSTWNLLAGAWTEIVAICDKPPHWKSRDEFAHESQAAFLILKGAKHLVDKPGGAYFPECLRSEFHSIRKTMEAHAHSYKIKDFDLGTANGFSIEQNCRADIKLRVNGSDLYMIDRWN